MPWEYAALLFGLPVGVMTAHMALWADWASIISQAEHYIANRAQPASETY